MPGTLKSTACGLCKDRRTRCDQKWPTCTQCRRRKTICPGPSSLLKFVPSGTGPSNGPKPQKKPQAMLAASKSTEAHANLHLDIVVKTSSSSQMPGPKSRLPAAVFSPRSAPTSIEDLVASRLVNYMTKDSCLDTKRYFKFIPSRLSSSSCLRDSVQLFCSTVTDYKRRLSADQSDTIKNYVQALQSLRQSLQGSQASKMETLTAIALLGRVEGFIEPEWKTFRKAHSEGIMLLTKQLGPPDMEDDYALGVFFENFEILVFHFIRTGTKSFLIEPQWAVELAALRYIRPELRPYMPELVIAMRVDFSAAPGLLQKLRGIYNDPFSSGSVLRASKIMKTLLERGRSLTYFLDKAIEKSVEFGEMRLIDIPHGLTGMVYETDVTFMNRVLLNAMGLVLAIEQIQYNLRVLYDDCSEPDCFFEDYRNSCLRLWMFTPLLITIERIVSSRVVTPLALSFEGADENEQTLLIDTVIKIDSYRKRLPRDREKIADLLISEAKMLTGRVPMLPE